MAGIYIHIPFCRKACHYCNFHFSTSLHRKPELLEALRTEIEMRGKQLPVGVELERNIHTVYFGGGTPSLLDANEITGIITSLKQQFVIDANAEITLEANPDDINIEKLKAWNATGINRLSIGVQSFFEDDLKWMNRAHNAEQAKASIALAQANGFHNLTIDLIYGTPTLTDENWKENVDKALSLGVKHLSCYALTVEENTPLDHFIKKGKVPQVNEAKQERHFNLLMEWMETAGFDHYEISNFAVDGYRSKHNSNYWSGNAYYGFGPAAHSFDGKATRWWNVANNAVYIDQLQNDKTAFEYETLRPVQRLNERIMTGLRTSSGVAFNSENSEIEGISVDERTFKALQQHVYNYAKEGLLKEDDGRLVLTKKGKLFADGIAAQLFME
jgi:oxygen-independent coproporphyrinogen-3 oxidase